MHVAIKWKHDVVTGVVEALVTALLGALLGACAYYAVL